MTPFPAFPATKFAASEWKRAHAPPGALALLESFHGWRRGTSGTGTAAGPR